MSGGEWLLFGSGVATGAALVLGLAWCLVMWIGSGEPDTNGDVERDSRGN